MERAVESMKHCEKRLPLKWHRFRERSNFPRIWFRDLKFRIWGLEIKHLKAHNFVWQWCFFLYYYLATLTTDLSSNLHRFVILCICWDTPTVKTSFWQLPIVSTVFKLYLRVWWWFSTCTCVRSVRGVGTCWSRTRVFLHYTLCLTVKEITTVWQVSVTVERGHEAGKKLALGFLIYRIIVNSLCFIVTHDSLIGRQWNSMPV